MESNEKFSEKFDKLIRILTSDEEKANEFSSYLTVEDSHPFACSLVGNMDIDMYRQAVKDFNKSGDVSGGTNCNKMLVEHLGFRKSIERG